jgi:hypothetical protein
VAIALILLSIVLHASGDVGVGVVICRLGLGARFALAKVLGRLKMPIESCFGVRGERVNVYVGIEGGTWLRLSD